MNNKCPENYELVSVIIPTWNRVDMLSEAIMSVLNQTYGNLEVLVCDDGSTDNSEEFVKSIKDERIKWLPGSHSGLPSIPRNRGIRNAKGYWLAFLDSDDLWQPEKLELQLNSLHLNKTFAIVTNAIRQDRQEGKGGLLLNLESVSKLSFADLIIDNKVITSSCLIKKDLIKRIGYFPESKKLKAYEDYAYWLRLSSFIYFDIINKPLVLYFDSPSTSIRSLAGNHLITKIYVMIDFFVWSFKKNRINLIPSFFLGFTAFIFNNFKKIYWKVIKCLLS